MGSINFGSGYDVIFPAGWNMAFWIAFVYRGARVGGARELATCSREQGVPHFPCDFPDTQAGREYNEEQRRSGEEKYERHPPAKRPNHVKFGMASPFAQDWNTLVYEWSEQVERLEVDTRQMVGSEKAAVNDSQSGHMKCLEPGHNEGKVVVNAEGQSVKDCQLGQIQCLEEDIEEGDVYNGSLKDNGVHSGDDPKALSSDVEACNKDQNEICEDVGSSILNETKEDIADDSERIDLATPNLQFNVMRTLSIRRRLQDIALSLKQTTKRRPQKNKIPDEEIIEYLTKTLTKCPCSLVCLNLRPLLKGCPQDNAVIYIPTPQDLMELQKDKFYGGPVEDVHKCNIPSSLIGQCSRKAIGWVTSGQYSFARGQGSAIGFCTFPGFCELIIRTVQKRCSPVVLVRNTSTFQYRFANIVVV
jgi:ribonuclease P/MRP protein subunit POP1